MKSPIFATSKEELVELLEANRNSDLGLKQRLKNSEAYCTDALNLIGAMQPVCTAADNFFNSDQTDLAELGVAVANYRGYTNQPRNATEDL